MINLGFQDLKKKKKKKNAEEEEDHFEFFTK
jgi:hypothetical protein